VLQSTPRAIHFKRILNFGEGHEHSSLHPDASAVDTGVGVFQIEELIEGPNDCILLEQLFIATLSVTLLIALALGWLFRCARRISRCPRCGSFDKFQG